jgi:hypothetical protein
MPKKQKPDNGLADTPQLMPLGKKSGKGKGWQKYLQSNAVKAGLAGVVVLLLVLIIGWQLMFGGGSGTKSIGTTASSGSSQAQSAPPPAPMPAETAPASPDQKDTSADQNAQNGKENTQGQPPEIQPEPAQPEQPQPQPRRGAHGVVQETAPGAENSSVQPKLPEDISKWEKAEFIRARQENNPKLLEAVAYLGEKFPGSVPKAQDLADLLKTPKPSDSTATPYAPGAMTGLIEAIIDALGKNGSDAARKTLTQVLSGKITTDDDKTSVEAVLKTLIQIPSAENDDILVNLIITPEEIRPATPQGTWQPGDMRSRTLDLARSNPSESLNIKLAKKLVQRGLEPNDPVVDFLLQDSPANLNAQLHLYQSEDLSADTKTRLEQYFLSRSSQAIALMMGISTGVEGAASIMPGVDPRRNQARGVDPRTIQPGSRERTPPVGPVEPNTGVTAGDASKTKISDYERGAYLAKLLWGEPLAGLMTQHLSEVRSLEKSAPDIVLASTLPLDSIHATMLKMLKKRASDGPQSLETAGWSDTTNKVLTDPGLIVVMKLLPRSKTLKTVPITGSISAPSPSRPGRYPTRAEGGGAGIQPSKTEAAQKKEQNEMEWITTLSKMVDAWCNRFESAAQAQKKAARKQQKVMEQPPTRLDEFEIPQDAKFLKDVKITAAYQLNWPDKAPGDLGKVKLAGLKIQYFRLQLTGMPKKTMSSLKQLARGGDVHDMSNGQWLEIIKNGSQPNTKRSLDILVTSADKQQVDLTQKTEESIDLQVDVLAIEITDPAAVKE